LDKIIFTGGSGILGTEIQKINGHNILFPISKIFDVLNIEQCEEYIKNNHIDCIIHAAAFTNIKAAETNFMKAIDINIIGTINLIKLCNKYSIKLVYISTDYVFDGEKGDYCADEPINPLSKYAKSKAAAELAVRMSDNFLIIRTSFFAKEFPYDKAFIDQYSTKDYVDIMAPKILQACLSDKIGIEHIYSAKETIFEKAKKRKPQVIPIQIKDFEGIKIPKDISLK